MNTQKHYKKLLEIEDEMKNTLKDCLEEVGIGREFDFNLTTEIHKEHGWVNGRIAFDFTSKLFWTPKMDANSDVKNLLMGLARIIRDTPQVKAYLEDEREQK